VQGLTLSHLLRELAGQPIPLPVGVGMLCGALYGLHAAHEARSETGELLGVVHRDVSPQNILVGGDGIPRVADFGIAKAAGRLQTTQDGQLKGKMGYMSPEQIEGEAVDRRTDVYAAAVVLWEVLCGRRLFTGDSPTAIWKAVTDAKVPKVSEERPEAPPALDAVMAKGLARDAAHRFSTAREMAVALEEALRTASSREIGEWVEVAATATLTMRAERIARIEARSTLQGTAAVTSGPDRPAASAEPHTTAVNVTGPGRPHAARRSPLILAATGAVAVLGAAAVITMTSARWQSSAAPGSSSVATAQPSSEVAASVPIVIEPGAAASASAARSTGTPATVASGASGPSGTSGTSGTSKPGAMGASPNGTGPRAGPATARPGHVDCAIPYTIDEDGVRHWKKGC
jgi:eukaryotic-like serine/threonine-protein kinase